ncbi:MAG: DnaB-like helicase C-terminal domain-containing protein [Verrucomicrobiota bacterium]
MTKSRSWPLLWNDLLRRLPWGKATIEKRGGLRKPSFRDDLLESLHDLERRFLEEGGASVPTGFADLDYFLGGIHAGEVLTIASAPGMGKTVLATNIALHAALKEAKRVAMVSLGARRQEMTQRILCSSSSVSWQDARNGALSPNRDFPRLKSAAARLSQASFQLETPDGSLGWAGFHAWWLSQKDEVDLLVIDDFESLCRPGEGDELARNITRLAKEFQTRILVTSTLSVPGSDRIEGKPHLEDLREGAALLDKGDALALLWRQDVCSSDPSTFDPDHAVASLLLAKNRHGSLGEVPLVFRKKVPRFEGRRWEQLPA